MTLPFDPDPAACAMLRALVHDAVLGARRAPTPRVQRFHGYAIRWRPLASGRIEVVISQGGAPFERTVVPFPGRANGR
jgi:hypothetical protein